MGGIQQKVFNLVLYAILLVVAAYTGKLYANPSAYPTKDVLPPDASTDGQTTVQLLTEAGVNTKDPAIAQQICG
jgi:hypothetical protein